MREPVSILALGKCAPEMLRGALDVLTPREAMMIARAGSYADLRSLGVTIRVGEHPDPAPDAVAVGREALAFAGRATEGTLLVLVSGGGSAMLELPAAGVSLETLTTVARMLMSRGADIVALNAVRAGLSAIKGGRLAAACPVDVVTLVVEDVAGRPELVASGPTVPALGAEDPREVLARYGVRVDGAIARALERPSVQLRRAPTLVSVVANEDARRGVIDAARRVGLELVDLGATLSGEAREAGARLAALAAQSAVGVVIGGETTVTVTGSGRGGRNQELVLGAFVAGARRTIASIGTDGVDGSSEHAGGFLDRPTWSGVASLGLDAGRALRENDSASFFARTGTAIVTGPTGCNVADVAWILPEE